MAARVGSVSGNWNDAATWGGNSPPVAGDTANINGDIVVTIPAGVEAASSSIVIGNTNNSAGISTLIINGKLTIDDTKNIKVGNGASKDGKLVFGPDSWLVNPTSLYFNNCVIDSTATAAHPAKITGAGQVTFTTVTGARQNIRMPYVSVQCTGIFNLILGDTTGSQTSALDLQHTIFVNTAAITLGATDTPNTTSMVMDYMDIRDVGGTHNITIRRMDGGAAPYSFSHNNVHGIAALITITPTTSTGLVMDDNVLINVRTTFASTSGGATYSNNLSTASATASNVVVLSDAGTGATVSGAYFVSTGDNLHPVATTGSGGSGTHTISGCLLDAVVDGTWTGNPDLLMPGLTPLAILQKECLVISTGEVLNGATHPNFANGIIERNNTLAGTISASVIGSGDLYRPEGVANLGTISLRSNLHLGNGKSGEFSIGGATSGDDQVIAYSDYNDITGTASGYSATRLSITAGNTAKTIPGAHDFAAAPQFFDPTRNLGKWNLHFGSGTDSRADAITYLLGRHGYRGTPNFDQGGTVLPITVAAVRDWVSAGYCPTNLTLRGAGDPQDAVAGVNPDIGAMPVRCKPGTFF